MSVNCSDCYNGCSEIATDKCIKYTGVDVPALDIKKGDSLSWVEQALITFLTSVIDGSGMAIKLEDSDYCTVVTQYLQTCETVTALDLFRALVKASCSLQTQIDAAEAATAVIEAPYTISCLTGVVTTSGTHAILQAVITKLCALDTTVTALALDLDTNYVKLSDFNSLAAAYIASTASANRYYTRMIPWVAVEYYGLLTGFDATGAGIVGTEWEKIYLCNGDNGTPDHRGRVGVGATSTPGLLPMSSAVDPGVSGNPAYTSWSVANGANTITLAESQIPSHTHTATSTVSPNPHDHTIGLTEDAAGNLVATGGQNAVATQTTSTTSLTVATNNANTGGGLAHNNYQPGIGAYYIIYIP